VLKGSARAGVRGEEEVVGVMVEEEAEKEVEEGVGGWGGVVVGGVGVGA
jgi:hypothetical protein